MFSIVYQDMDERTDGHVGLVPKPSILGKGMSMVI